MVLAVGQLVSIGVYADKSVHLNPIESLRHGPQQVLETGTVQLPLWLVISVFIRR